MAFPRARAWFPVAVLALAALAGCSDPDDDETGAVPTVTLPPLVHIVPEDTMTFLQSVVTPAVGIANDLYEPTMEVSDTGTLYVAGHVIGAATTGTPAYFSVDDGKTWEQLPFLGPVQAPPPIQGAQPPPGDEGFIVGGDDGQVW